MDAFPGHAKPEAPHVAAVVPPGLSECSQIDEGERYVCRLSGV